MKLSEKIHLSAMWASRSRVFLYVLLTLFPYAVVLAPNGRTSTVITMVMVGVIVLSLAIYAYCSIRAETLQYELNSMLESAINQND